MFKIIARSRQQQTNKTRNTVGCWLLLWWNVKIFLHNNLDSIFLEFSLYESSIWSSCCILPIVRKFQHIKILRKAFNDVSAWRRRPGNEQKSEHKSPFSVIYGLIINQKRFSASQWIFFYQGRMNGEKAQKLIKAQVVRMMFRKWEFSSDTWGNPSVVYQFQREKKDLKICGNFIKFYNQN